MWLDIIWIAFVEVFLKVKSNLVQRVKVFTECFSSVECLCWLHTRSWRCIPASNEQRKGQMLRCCVNDIFFPVNYIWIVCLLEIASEAHRKYIDVLQETAFSTTQAEKLHFFYFKTVKLHPNSRVPNSGPWGPLSTTFWMSPSSNASDSKPDHDS